MSMPDEHLSPKPHLASVKPEGSDDQFTQRVRSLRLPPQAAGGSSTGRLALWSLCLLLATSTAVLAYLRVTEPRAATPGSAKSPPAASATDAPASTAPAAASSGQFALESKGYIIPAHQILVSPKVSGMVTRLHIVEGQRVAKGDVLAEIEDIDYRADRDRAKALLASAQHNLEELRRGSRPEEIAQSRAELAESEAQRVQLEADFKRSSEMLARKVISQEQYDSALSKYHAMEKHLQKLQQALKLLEDGPRVERIDVARAQVRQAEAELAKAQWRLDNCVIRAPISGTILRKNAEEGNIVNAIAFNGSYSLCEMADLADLEVELTIQERDIAKVFKGQKCLVRVEAYPEREYKGTVSRLMPIADRAKGAVPVRVKVVVPAEEEGVYLKPEMGALVSFLNK
jgi:HlyD family secretion protein